VLDFLLLTSADWLSLRQIRLTALRESPRAFLAAYDQENGYTEERWRAEFARGDWIIGLLDNEPVSLLGTTREPDTPADQCYIEYLWVAPDCRRSGIASRMLTAVLDRLQATGVQTTFLWVLSGNDPATRLYKQAGFVSTNRRQLLPADPTRSEELLRLDLRSPPS
jgi:ribosomal protein S18 acetylase RimI-like enzyme